MAGWELWLPTLSFAGAIDKGGATRHELLRTTQSATQLATAAQVFGQEDDISVISLTRAVLAS